MKQIMVKNLGQLAQADIEFGDMTVLVGPQASGKSIFLQLIKLSLDFQNISQTLKKHGFYWQNSKDFLHLYFGEGMQGIWNDTTSLQVDNQELSLEKLLGQRKKKPESLFFLIPAHRVMTLMTGWPGPFRSYGVGDPYVVKQFSENIRQLMDAGLGGGEGPIFPQVGKMNKSIRDAIDNSVFWGAQLTLDRDGMRKRIVLKIGGFDLPLMSWSAGQREFVPLLMGLYWLLPSSKISKRKNVDWVVIEEPEMGLHPQAISALLISFLELMHRGYKVIISTHSPQILEMIWAIQNLSRSKAAAESVVKMFGLKKTQSLLELSNDILENKSFKTYFFSRMDELVTVKDISSLDAVDMDDDVSDWGGLTSFSTKASEIVAKAIAKREYEKKNKFKEAVEATPEIAQCYQDGLQAVKEKKIIKFQNGQKLEGSVFIDDCLSQDKKYSQQNRWDYVVGYKGHAFYIEVHGAQDSKVKTMKKKFLWVKEWRLRSGSLSKIRSTYHWIQTRGDAITRGSRWFREITELGLYPVKILDLDQALKDLDQ